MRLRQIEVFHAVYTSGSMTNAASLLHVSQPAVSKVLAHAEQQLGYALFDRVKGRLIATPEAHQLFAHVAKVYKDIDDLKSISRQLGTSDAGRIRIAATPAFGLDLLPTAVASWYKQFPDTRFEIETLHHHEIISALTQQRIDIGLSFNPEITPGITHRRLCKGEFVVVAPAGLTLSNSNYASIDDLREHPFIVLDSKGPLGRQLNTLIESSGVRFNTVAVCETYHIAKALVSKRCGVAIVDEITALSTAIENVSVWRLEPRLQFDVSACHFENSPLSLVGQKFLNHLETCVQQFLQPDILVGSVANR